MTFSETIKHLCVHSVFVMVVVPHTYLPKVFAAGYFQSVLWKLMLLKNCRYTWTKIDYIYIALQVLYTVNMLNRFNAISPSILQCIFLFFFFFFSCFWADAYGSAWAGKVNVRATLSLFFILITGSHFKRLFVKALLSNMFLTLSLRKGEH